MISFRLTSPIKQPLSSTTGTKFWFRAGIYLEDLYVHPAYRGKGYGRLFLRHLAQIALERQCVRLEWASLDWNEAAGRFYKALGARPMEGWTTYRLDGEALARLAE